MDSLYMNDGQVMGYGADGVAEMKLQPFLDAHKNKIVGLSCRFVRDDSDPMIWLNNQMVHDIISWLNAWLEEEKDNN